jgi:hypothetical protein
MATKIVTGKCRLSYVTAFQPRAQEEGKDPKYSVLLLIPKTDKATIAKINAAVEEAKEAGKAKWGGKVPAGLKLPLRDGDVERDEPEYEGHFFVNATSMQKPGVVDSELNPILDQSELYSGCYGRVSLNFFPFSKAGNRGVAAGLNNIQKLEDGEPLGGASSRPEDDFGSDDFLN